MMSHDLNRYYEPLRLPPWAAAISFPYTQRVVASPPPRMGLQHWTVHLREHADAASSCYRGVRTIPRTGL